jgi:hypothetical protein
MWMLLEALRGETKHGFYLFPSQTVEHGDDFIDGETVFEVPEHGCHGHACTSKNPSAAELSRYALTDGHCDQSSAMKLALAQTTGPTYDQIQMRLALSPNFLCNLTAICRKE